LFPGHDTQLHVSVRDFLRRARRQQAPISTPRSHTDSTSYRRPSAVPLCAHVCTAVGRTLSAWQRILALRRCLASMCSSCVLTQPCRSCAQRGQRSSMRLASTRTAALRTQPAKTLTLTLFFSSSGLPAPRLTSNATVAVPGATASNVAVSLMPPPMKPDRLPA